MTDSKNMLAANAVLDTLHVNFWGIPGTGKEVVARELDALLNQMGVDAERVQEYAKELGWQGALVRVDANNDLVEVDQFLISAEQYRRENMVHGVVQVVITDAPALAGALYAHEDDELELRAMLRRRTSGWRNLDILLERDLEQSYGSRGRIKSREESLAMMPRLENLLATERPGFVRMNVNNAIEQLAPMVIKRLKGAPMPGQF